MSCKGRVVDVIVENCVLTVKYSDCTTQSWSIANCGSTTPIVDEPGPGPDPHPTPDVRCRVARHVADNIVDNRYIDFLEAATPAAAGSFGIGMAAVVSAALAAWAWSAAIYPSLYAYGMSVALSGDQATILTYWSSNQALVRDTVAQALYCVLPESGAIDTTTRDLFRSELNALGSLIYTRLAEFMGMYPLERLRDEAFEASVTTDEVDCEAFECGGSPSGEPCAGLEMVWLDVGATPSTWENVPGTIDTSGWSGDVEGITQSPPGSNVDYTASRTPNGNWIHTGAAMTAIGVAVRYTPEVPCVVTHAAVSYAKNSGNSILLSIVGRRASDGVYQVLSKQIRVAIQPLSGALVWTGSPIALSEVLFIIHSSNSSATAQVQITRCEVNHPEP